MEINNPTALSPINEIVTYAATKAMRKSAAGIEITSPDSKVTGPIGKRMSQQVYGLNRLTDLDELKHRAQEVLSGLEKGEI